jgi:hypothetical protein
MRNFFILAAFWAGAQALCPDAHAQVSQPREPRDYGHEKVDPCPQPEAPRASDMVRPPLEAGVAPFVSPAIQPGRVPPSVPSVTRGIAPFNPRR